jgi:DNA-binding MarR family transcriptional regulator/GNAT superfamily N-acetyltransferase
VGVNAVTEVREFNRFYTGVIGVLRDRLLSTPYTLTEARVIFELAQVEDAEVAEVRRTLDLDPGYLSRILARFEADGLVARRRADSDGRRQIVSLTARGRDTWRTLDRRSTEEIGALLDRLPEDERETLLIAMATIRRLLGGGDAQGSVPRAVTSEARSEGGTARARGSARAERAPAGNARRDVVLRAPAPGDLGWILERHGALYAREYGYDATFEGMVARIIADFAAGHDPAREAAWIAELDGRRVGSILCVRRDDTTAQLRVLLVEPGARGLGIGGRLVDECLAFARRAGYAQIVLFTYDVHGEARRIYERAGFRLDEQHPIHAHGRSLVDQLWSLTL